MAKKKNRGKKSSGAKPSNSAVPDNAPSAHGKSDALDTTVCVEETSSASHLDVKNTSVCLPSVTAVPDVCKKQCDKEAAMAKDQGAFLSEFESKALQVATQTVQQPEPEVVEKVVEIVKVVEKEVEVKVQDPGLKSQVEELSRENAELRTQVASLQKVSLPSIDDSPRISELEEEVRTVTDKVTHYQKVLADTENLLKSLQASVESEEVAWKERLSEKENSLRQLTADKANLQLEVKQLEDTLETVKQSEDMQAQLKVLQQQLQKEEKEKASLLEELNYAQDQLSKTATQGGSGEASLLELKANNDKLRTLVSVGQDASRQQEQLIEQLQKELASVKTASSNGPANEDQCQEDNTSRADTASLMSASSASVTDTLTPQVQSGASAKKAKKKKKGAGAAQ